MSRKKAMSAMIIILFYSLIYADMDIAINHLEDLCENGAIYSWSLYSYAISNSNDSVRCSILYSYDVTNDDIEATDAILKENIDNISISASKAVMINIANPKQYLIPKNGTDELVLDLPSLQFNYESTPTISMNKLFYEFDINSELKKIEEDYIDIKEYYIDKNNVISLEMNDSSERKEPLENIEKMFSVINTFIKEKSDNYFEKWKVRTILSSSYANISINFVVPVSSNDNNYNVLINDLDQRLSFLEIQKRIVISKEINLQSDDYSKIPWFEKTRIIRDHLYSIEYQGVNIMTFGLDPYLSENEIAEIICEVQRRYKEQGIIIKEVD